MGTISINDKIARLKERYRIGIYPAVASDGIGTYIKGVNEYLQIPVVSSRSHILSPLQFMEKIPEGLDLVHVPHFVVPLQRRKTKVVCTIQDVTPLIFKGGLNSVLTAYLRMRIAWSVCKADHLIFTSKNTFHDVVRLFGPVKEHSIIPLGVEEAMPAEAIPRLDYPYRYFFSVGRRRPHKNIERIIKAFALVAGSVNCHLVFGGKEDVNDSGYIALARQLGVEDRIHFAGFLTSRQLAAHYRQAIALLFPSLYEGFGLPILEAMSYGCPVITSNLSSMPEVAGDGAILVDPCSSESIAGAMQELLENPELRNHLIERGFLNAERFSWELTANLTADVYKKVLEVSKAEAS